MSDHETQTWVITGASARGLIEDAAEVSSSPDARIVIRKHGDSITLQWYGANYDGPPFNDSAQCPGRPGCP